MLEMFNAVYFLWIFAAIILFVFVYYIFRNKGDKFKYWFLFGMIVFSWIIHFSRWWLDPDMQLYEMFMKDLCGFSTLVYPFFFLSKNKVYKDYMYFVGGFFALHSLFFPNNIFGDAILYYNTVRFFFAHFILVSVPLLLIFWKMHIPNIKNVPYMLLFVLIAAMYNFTLSSFFYEVGLVSRHINFMGLWANTDSVYRYFEVLAPFLRYEVVKQGETVSKAIPFFYMIPALLVVYTPIWIIMSLPFVRKKKSTVK